MKSHFTFSKSQRHGIFLLIIIIVVLQCIYFFIDVSPEKINVNQALLETYNKEIDSLRFAEFEARKNNLSV